VYRRLG